MAAADEWPEELVSLDDLEEAGQLPLCEWWDLDPKEA